jgi:L-malate glycosyltransferase
MRVLQFLPTYEPSAVAAHALQLDRLLRDMGIESAIFADQVHPDYEGRARHQSDFGAAFPARRDDLLLYQLAVGSLVADFVHERPERLVINYHNITPARFFDRWEPDALHAVSWGQAQLRKLAAGCELGIAVSRYNERELQRAGYRATAVAPVLVDLEGLRSASDEAVEDRLRAAKADGGSDWLFVGRLSPNKAQHDLIKALAAYRRIYDDRARLHLVGSSSSDSYTSALRAFADALGLADAVFLHRGVPAATLAAHYASADVFVCLSEHEGFCVPLLEAMHHRLPIVALAAAAVPETLGHAGLLLPGKDPGLVAAAVHRVISDLAVRAGLVEHGQARLDHFTLERSRAAFRDALLPLLEGGTQ